MADWHWYPATEAPLTRHGLCGEAAYTRLPSEMLASLPPALARLAVNTAGARIRFRTDASALRARIVLADTCIKTHITPLNMAGAELYENERRVAVLRPKAYGNVPFQSLDGYWLENTIEQEVKLSGKMADYTLYLPTFTGIRAVSIGLPENGTVLPATPYRYEKPIVFYGSSITQGACASRPSLSYPAQVCSALNADFVNLGFAGNARGEQAVAQYIARQEMTAFVLDYDHNALDVEWLQKTHEPFFRTVRQAQPLLPILIISRPWCHESRKDTAERFSVIEQTYQNALHDGDRHVALLDGRAFFPADTFDQCLTDFVHPNDHGFHLMAGKVWPALKALIEQP